MTSEKYEVNSLLVAAVNGHEACVRVLIAAKAKVSFANSIGETALHFAATNGHASICQLLVDEGASLTALDRNGKMPLEVAKARGEAECVAILEKAGAVLPPAVAAAYAFVDEHIAKTKCFRFAVTKTADEKAPAGVDKQIFDAAERGQLDKLLGLCMQWASHPVIDAYPVDENNEYDEENYVSPFLMPKFACSIAYQASLYSKLTKLVLTSLPPIPLPLPPKLCYMTPLLRAAQLGHDACVLVLLAAKADVGCVNHINQTALHFAAGGLRTSICRALINEGASLTAVEDEGETPLDNCLSNDECEALLECKAVLEEATAKEKAEAEALEAKVSHIT